PAACTWPGRRSVRRPRSSAERSGARVTFTRYVRPYGEVRAIMIDRAHGRVANRNPFEFTDAAEVERAFAGLRSLDPAEWAGAFGAVATEHAERARAAEGRGDPATAKTEWLAAYNFERVARYPAPSSPAKAAAYARERAHYANAARFFDPPLEIVRIPFRGRPGDGAVARGDVDGTRVAIVGGSTGGYWATKLAHTHRERIRAAVNHGGPVHEAFTERWIERSQRGDYPFELVETLAWAFGLGGPEEYVAFAPRLSLLEQRLLDRPCAALLCVNGVDDTVFPIADHELLLRHGEPKAARFFPGGHMGNTPQTTPTIVAWVDRELRR